MQIAKIYANALFELSIENKELEEIYLEIANLKNSVVCTDEFINLICNPNFSLHEKQNVISKIFKNKTLLNFILLVVKKMRFKFIKNIFEFFCDKYEIKKNILHVKIISVFYLSEDIISKIKKIIEEKYMINVLIDNVIDKEIIGGFIIRIGDIKIDASIKSRLDDFKNLILEKKLCL